jgi:hypothetical protein
LTGHGYNVKVGGSNNPNSVSQDFSNRNYGSLEKAKIAAEQFRQETVATLLSFNLMDDLQENKQLQKRQFKGC